MKKKVKPRTTKKQPVKRKTRPNPGAFIKLSLSDEEVNALFFLKSRYESARILLDAYDEETGNWDLDIVARAYIATKDDGGDIGTVPGIGGDLKVKVSRLFKILREQSDKLDMRTYRDLMKVSKRF